MHSRFDPQLVPPGTRTLTLPLHGTRLSPIPQCKSAITVTLVSQNFRTADIPQSLKNVHQHRETGTAARYAKSDMVYTKIAG
jgi:hypothetical protein